MFHHFVVQLLLCTKVKYSNAFGLHENKPDDMLLVAALKFTSFDLLVLKLFARGFRGQTVDLKCHQNLTNSKLLNCVELYVNPP